MFYRKFLCAALVPSVFLLSAFAQTTEQPKPNEISPELRKEAVQFLRETATEANSLRTLENRISFASEMAGLMWFNDEKEARAMYQAAITDFKQLLMQYDAEMTALGVVPDKKNPYETFFGSGDESEKARLSQKFSKAMSVRKQIALSLAEHEPSLAFGFYTETLQIISNAEFRKQLETQDSYFEVQLLQEIAKNDPAKAVEYGKKNLGGGVNWNHLGLLRKIYEKDPEKGAEFASEIVKKFKSMKVEPDQNPQILNSALGMGAENFDKAKKDGKKSMFTEQELRDLAEILGQFALISSEPEFSYAINLNLIERFAPARAAQIRAKSPAKKQQPLPNSTPGIPNPKIITTTGNYTEEADSEELKKAKTEEDFKKDVENLSTKELPKEERARIVEKSRKIVAGLPNRQAKIVALGVLAGQVARAGDRELASEIMRDAQALVNPSPKNYRDYLETWLLINGLAESDPEKAFPVLEETIFRLNDTLSAFIKVAEFIDVSGEIVDDGEVQVGSFGGSMIREITGSLGMADSVVRRLSLADFGKMKAVTNRFDRTEVRMLAKMLVLRSILGNKQKEKDTVPEFAEGDF